jgi:hypothetical protein
MDRCSCPTLATKTETWRGWGTRQDRAPSIETLQRNLDNRTIPGPKNGDLGHPDDALDGLQACAAGGLYRLTVDPDGIVGGEECGDAGDVAGLTDAAERRVLFNLFLEVAAYEARGVDALGFDQAGI